MSRLQVIVRTLGIQFLLFVVLMRLAPSVLSLSLLILMASETGEVTLGGYAAGIAALSFAVMMPLYSAVARKFGHTPVLVTTGILNIPMMAILLWQFLQFSNKAFQQGIVGVLVAAALAGATIPPMAAMMRSYWSREYATSKDRKMLNSAIALESMLEVLALPLAAVLTGAISLFASPLYVVLALIAINMLGVLFAISRINKPLFMPIHSSRLSKFDDDAVHGDHRGFIWLPLLGAVCIGAIIGATQSSLAAYTLNADDVETVGFYIGAMGLSSATVGALLLAGRVRIAGWQSWLLSAVALIALTMMLSIPVTNFGVALALLALGAGIGAATVCMESVTTAISARGYLELALTFSQSTLTVGLAIGLVWGALVGEGFGFQAAMLIPLIAATIFFIVGHFYGYLWRRTYEVNLRNFV